MIRGNSHLLKLFAPKMLLKWIIREKYDIQVLYLEGTCARMISGCQDRNTKLVSWIHIEQKNKKIFADSFRSYREVVKSYNAYQKNICVSETVKKDFLSLVPLKVLVEVIYNTNESQKIQSMAEEKVKELDLVNTTFKIAGVGKLTKGKGFDRNIRIGEGLIAEGYPLQIYILGSGPEERKLRRYIAAKGL